MIYRVVDDITGEIVMSLSARSDEAAARYLKPGQSLMTGGGPLMLNDAELIAVDGVITRKPDATAPGELAGEGETLTPVD